MPDLEKLQPIDKLKKAQLKKHPTALFFQRIFWDFQNISDGELDNMFSVRLEE